MKWMIAVFLQLLAALPAVAGESAAEIARKASEINLGYAALSADMTMTIHRGADDASPTRREYLFKSREGKRGNDKVLIDFKSPSTISGTRMLGIGQADKDNEQWLYLPAFSRTRKIAQNSTSAAFVGSDFSFEDLSPLSIDKYDYGDAVEQVANPDPRGETRQVLRIQRMPRYKNSAYDRQLVWIEPGTYRVLQVEAYKDGVLLKTARFSDFSLHGSYTWPNTVRMTSLQKGSFTELGTRSVRFGAEQAPEREFNSELLGD